MIGPAVDQLVVLLLRAQLVEVDHLVERGRLMLLARRRLGIAVVVKAAAVLRPVDAREADPFQVVVELLARFDIQHVDLLPIAAGLRAGVRQIAAVVARR